MLPNISIDARDVCQSGFSLHSGRIEPIGQAYWFDWQKMKDAARSEGMNLDKFLTMKIGSFLARKKLRSNVLLCYTPHQGRFMLMVCSKHNTNFSFLHSFPGDLESGQDYLPTRAAPLIFYGGLQLYRLYCIQEQPATGYYVCDCSLCDLPYSKLDTWVRGEGNLQHLQGQRRYVETENELLGEQSYLLYEMLARERRKRMHVVSKEQVYTFFLRLYRPGEDSFPNFEQGFSLSHSSYYVCDMGCQYGVCIAEAQHKDYKNIQEQTEHYYDYSTVPVEPSEKLKTDGMNFALQHVFCKWIRGDFQI